MIFGLVDTSLIRLLTILVAVLAGLGVLNAVLMLTRERVHDLGVFKAVGMTPRQAITMVTCWVIAPAIAAAVIALPAGMALQDAVIHAIAGDQARPPPHRHSPAASCTSTPPAGSPCSPWPAWPSPCARGPATWAAVSKTTTALRAEVVPARHRQAISDVRFAPPSGPTSAVRWPSGMASVQSRSAQVRRQAPPSPLAAMTALMRTPRRSSCGTP